MRPTQRTFKDVETDQVFRLYTDDTNSKYKLIVDEPLKPTDFAKGTELNGFYLCVSTGATIKIDGSKKVRIDPGTVYNLKEKEVITHIKYDGYKRFIKF